MKRQPYFPIGVLVIVALLACSACIRDDDNVVVPPPLSEQDQHFMVQASFGNWNEIAAGNLADSISADSSIKMFGRDMHKDHGTAQLELESIALSWGIEVPNTPDSAHLSILAQLQALKGHSFDTAYINGQVRDHAKAIALFEEEAIKGEQSVLKTYVNKYLPVIRMHKAMADTIALRLVGP